MAIEKEVADVILEVIGPKLDDSWHYTEFQANPYRCKAESKYLQLTATFKPGLLYEDSQTLYSVELKRRFNGVPDNMLVYGCRGGNVQELIDEVIQESIEKLNDYAEQVASTSQQLQRAFAASKQARLPETT